MPTNIKTALQEWTEILSDNKQLQTAPNIPSCIEKFRDVPAILYPQNKQQLIDCIKVANKHKVAIYPVSTGNNWGYGSSLPVTNNCVILNLSKMTKIIDFDPENGVITLEPGITQRQLGEFLDKNNYSYLVPVTGAGPDCSIIGNAIERGYGITPYADHFFSLMSLQAIFADGSTYQPCLQKFGGKDMDNIHKWGIGPYLEGLFTQSNYAVVNQMTICLAATPETMCGFFFSVKNDDDMQHIVAKIKKVLSELGGITGSINLMNKLRVLSMTAPYPRDKRVDGLLPESLVEEMASKRQVMTWTGAGALYGNKAVVRVAKKEIRKILKPYAKRLSFFSATEMATYSSIVKKVSFLENSVVGETLDTLSKTLQLLAGRPSEIALPLAYWRSGNVPVDGSAMKPDIDGCGLIWYSPLIPMKPEKVREFTEMTRSICIKHRIEPLITLTSLSDRCFDSTIPILFDKQDEDEVKRAHACYEELFETGKEKGFVPYRLGIQSMYLLEKYHSIPDLTKKIKAIVDPNGIIAPGRYLPADK